jgi:beta-glucosidase
VAAAGEGIGGVAIRLRRGNHARLSTGDVMRMFELSVRASLLLFCAGLCVAAEPEQPWMNPALDADKRAALVLAAMTREEKQTLVMGFFATDAPWKNFKAHAEARLGSAGYVPGIPRLGIPPQWQTDAGLGVATQGGAPLKRERTALPSGLATAATWDPGFAFRAGAMIGAEARASGFNVMLAGSANLTREPRNGRNFEYAGEDPLLAGVLVAEQIKGIESNQIISTLKHYALNDQETDRNTLNVIIDKGQAQMSDLLAFQIAIERADPGSVMCSYNKVWGDHSCENTYLLTDVLRTEWSWPGYVMSDWGATHSTVKAIAAGLDQQSGFPFDAQPFFGQPLLDAIAKGQVPEASLDKMALRVLRTLFAKGVVDHPVVIGPIDFAAHAKVSREGAEQGAVLLKNERDILPLGKRQYIAVIGGHADKGVLAGGGSSLVYPVGGNAVPDLKPVAWPGPVMFYPSSPLQAIAALAPEAKVEYASGADRAAAVKLAAASDVVVIFVTQWATESEDVALTLPDNQDGLILAIAATNKPTVVVLQTGGAVYMPWIDKVRGVLEVWYPGTSGGEAIANLLFGEVNPSGHLPISFLRDATQLARKDLTETKSGKKSGLATYNEGAAVGYKWHDLKKSPPLFAFGHGLSYSRFTYHDLEIKNYSPCLLASFTVHNAGKREGMVVPQIYVAPVAGGWEAPKRLGGWKKMHLAPGASAGAEVCVDLRLLATFDATNRTWNIANGAYRVLLGASAEDIQSEASVYVAARSWPVGKVRQ